MSAAAGSPAGLIGSSYRRYLADGASGLILIVAVYLFFVGDGQRLENLPPASAILIATFVIFLAIPLGLSINATSWFAFGGVQRLGWFFNNDFLMELTRDVFNFRQTCEAFDVNRCDYNQVKAKYNSVQVILDAFFSDIHTVKLDHVSGIRVFVRNVMLLLVFFAVYDSRSIIICGVNTDWLLRLGVMAVALWLLAVLGNLLTNYIMIHTLFDANILLKRVKYLQGKDPGGLEGAEAEDVGALLIYASLFRETENYAKLLEARKAGTN